MFFSVLHTLTLQLLNSYVLDGKGLSCAQDTCLLQVLLLHLCVLCLQVINLPPQFHVFDAQAAHR